MSTPTQQQSAYEQLTAWIADEMAAGRPDDEILQSLLAQGWSEADATAAISAVRNADGGNLSVPLGYTAGPLGSTPETEPLQDAKALRRAAGRRKIIVGCCWFFGGLVVTVGTFAAAADGGTYVVAWGAIAFGAFDIIAGLIMLA